MLGLFLLHRIYMLNELSTINLFDLNRYYGEEGVSPEDFFSILHDFNTVFMVSFGKCIVLW